MLLDRAAALGTDPRGTGPPAGVGGGHGGTRRPAAVTARLVEELAREPVPAEVLPLFAYAVVYVDQSHRVDFESSFTLLPRALGELAATGTEAFPGLAEQSTSKLVLATVYTDDPRGWSALDRHGPQVSPLARLQPSGVVRPGADGARRGGRAARTGRRDGPGAGGRGRVARAVDGRRRGRGRRPAVAAVLGAARLRHAGTIAKAKGYQDYLAGRWDQAESRLREAGGRRRTRLPLQRVGLPAPLRPLPGRPRRRGRVPGRWSGTSRPARAAGPAMSVRRGPSGPSHRSRGAWRTGRYEEAYRVLAGLTRPVCCRADCALVPPAVLRPGGGRRAHRADSTGGAHVAAARATPRMADISPHHAFLLAAATALAARGDGAEARFATTFAVGGAEQWVFPMARLRPRPRAVAAPAPPGDEPGTRCATAAHAFLVPWAPRPGRRRRSGSCDAAEGIATQARRPARQDLLTVRQARVARPRRDGLTDKQIGAELRLSSARSPRPPGQGLPGRSASPPGRRAVRCAGPAVHRVRRGEEVRAQVPATLAPSAVDGEERARARAFVDLGHRVLVARLASR